MNQKTVELFLRKNGVLVALALAAIGLLLIGSRSFGGTETQKSVQQQRSEWEENYRAELTERATALCNSVSGVRDAEVLLTFSSGFVYEYGSSSQIRAVQYPVPRGAAVVCRGGDIPQIEKELVDLLSCALGISSNQISVSGK